MLTYNIKSRGKMPIYEFLYNCIKTDILSGRFSKNERLPSKRALAGHLGIGVITVENAYAQLEVEGYITSVEKRGYFVCEIGDLKKYVSQKPRYIDDDVLPTDGEKKYIADFTSNNINAEKFPFSVWAKLMRRILCDENTHLLAPVSHNGALPLRRAIANHLYKFRGFEVLPENIIVGSGTEYLYNILIQLLGREKIIALENPGYNKIAKIYGACGVKYKYIDMDENGLSVEQLSKSGARVAHVSPSHHFPTGTVMTAGRRFELLNWAEKTDGYIIEDEYDSEFKFSGKPVPPLKSVDANGHVIYMNTFSKTIAPSMRISYMILPSELMSVYNKKLGFYSCTVPAVEQYVLTAFLEEGYFEKHINRMKTYYKSLRNAVIKAIESSNISKMVSVEETDSGLHFPVKIKTEISDSTLVKLLDDKGIKISFLSQYVYGNTKKFEHTAIINYSGINLENIEKAITIAEEIYLKKF